MDLCFVTITANMTTEVSASKVIIPYDASAEPVLKTLPYVLHLEDA